MDGVKMGAAGVCTCSCRAGWAWQGVEICSGEGGEKIEVDETEAQEEGCESYRDGNCCSEGERDDYQESYGEDY